MRIQTQVGRNTYAGFSPIQNLLHVLTFADNSRIHVARMPGCGDVTMHACRQAGWTLGMTLGNATDNPSACSTCTLLGHANALVEKLPRSLKSPRSILLAANTLIYTHLYCASSRPGRSLQALPQQHQRLSVKLMSKVQACQTPYLAPFCCKISNLIEAKCFHRSCSALCLCLSDLLGSP